MIMNKLKFICVFVCLGLVFLGCEKTDKARDDIFENLSWNLTNISGGFAGVDNDFDTGLIVWTFDSGSLTVVNNNTSQDYDVLASGDYSYSILQAGGKIYLKIDGLEMGEIVASPNSIVVDQNKKSTGAGADHFAFTLTM